ncbi:MAG: TonB-dependent receptor, partial [Niveispirillum sp.]|nr:TonB-dependent receptor [Niveispirillum sp.]
MSIAERRACPAKGDLRARSIHRLLLSTGLMLAMAAPVAAQTAPAQNDGATLEEIVVTARRRSEALQDTPVAVTAFTAEALEARSVETLDNIARFTPNIRFDGAAALSGGNYNATVFIRGIGQNDFAIFSDPGVGFYVDGVYYARSIGGIMDAVDLASVEVLRGPQGTLFGKNTIGGAVLISTQRPTDDLSGRVELT